MCSVCTCVCIYTCVCVQPRIQHSLGGGGGGGGVGGAAAPPLPDDKDLKITCCVILKSPDYSVVRTNVNEAVEHDRAGAEWTRLS